MLFHEVTDLRIYFIDLSCFGVPPPGGVFSLLWGLSSLSGVSLVFGQMASLLVENEAFAVPHMLCSFTGREIDLVYVHGIRIPSWSSSSSLSRWDVAGPPSSEFPESYHIPVELSCFIKPLFPLPSHLVLSLRKHGGSHHDGQLIGHHSLESVHQDAIKVDSAVSLGQSEGSGVLVKVTVELVHA